MRNKITTIYVYDDSLPSSNLKKYLGGYAMLFGYTDCSTVENKKECTDTLKSFANDSKLYMPNGRATTQILYPSIVLSKDNSAHIVPSISEFEKLMDCGILKNNFNFTQP
jgi:hypothetical protein